jgi:hypothetical protein
MTKEPRIVSLSGVLEGFTRICWDLGVFLSDLVRFKQEKRVLVDISSVLVVLRHQNTTEILLISLLNNFIDL